MKKYSIDELKEELKLYKHETKGRVEFADVDSHRVVHNVKYFYYLEWARIMYLEHIGMPFDNHTFTDHDIVLIVHNEADYLDSLRLADNYKIMTRVTRLGNSSLTFDNIVLRENGDICAKATSTVVFLDSKTNATMRIKDEYREKIIKLEGSNMIMANG